MTRLSRKTVTVKAILLQQAAFLRLFRYCGVTVEHMRKAEAVMNIAVRISTSRMGEIRGYPSWVIFAYLFTDNLILLTK